MKKSIQLWTKQIEQLPKGKDGKFRYYLRPGTTQLMDPNGGDVIVIPTSTVKNYYGGAKHTPVRILKKAKLIRYENDPHTSSFGSNSWPAYYEGTIVTESLQTLINIFGDFYKSNAIVGYCNQSMERFMERTLKPLKNK